MLQRVSTGYVHKRYERTKDGWIKLVKTIQPYSLVEQGRIKANLNILYHDIHKLKIPTVLKTELKENYLEDNLLCYEQVPRKEWRKISLLEFDRPAKKVCPDTLLGILWEEVPFDEEDVDYLWFHTAYCHWKPRDVECSSSKRICYYCYLTTRYTPKCEEEAQYSFEWHFTFNCHSRPVRYIREDISTRNMWCSICKVRALFFFKDLTWWEKDLLDETDSDE